MRNSIVDLIVLLARRVRLGESLNDIKDDTLKNFDKSEISAAYSWILQKYPVTENTPVPGNAYLKSDKTTKIPSNKANPDHNHRVLHFAERMLITPEAYGYLLEMVEIGIIDQHVMESVIEKVMFHTSEKITLEQVKKMIAEHLFETNRTSQSNHSFLKGNESVN